MAAGLKHRCQIVTTQCMSMPIPYRQVCLGMCVPVRKQLKSKLLLQTGMHEHTTCMNEVESVCEAFVSCPYCMYKSARAKHTLEQVPAVGKQCTKQCISVSTPCRQVCLFMSCMHLVVSLSTCIATASKWQPGCNTYMQGSQQLILHGQLY